MSKRAEEAASRALPNYPPETYADEDEYIEVESVRSVQRAFYRKGYEQAEKDLVLTWEDMAKIDAIILDVNNEFAVDYSKEIDRQKFYEEVLKRFREIKDEQVHQATKE